MNSLCDDLPRQISEFVDTFVDFAVSGIFLNRQDQQPQNAHHEQPPPPPEIMPTTYPQPGRLVAIGDIHGDLQKAKQSLRLAEVIDDHDRWIGGNTFVVQVGDILDRGGEELRILYFLEKLKQEAKKSGGTLVVMNGNHEIMNVYRNFRYATKEGFSEFVNWAQWFEVGNKMKTISDASFKQQDLFRGIPANLNPEIRARIAALQPGGPISTRFLSINPTVLVVGDSVFAHGGILPDHVDYGLERINGEVSEWIRGVSGDAVQPPNCVRSSNSVIWLRKYSGKSVKDCECELLEHALATIPNAKRMIVGHTIQEAGINGACQNRVIRIDVGMSKGCSDGIPEVLEIKGTKDVRILTSNPLYQPQASETATSSSSACGGSDRVGLGLLLIPDETKKQVEVNS